MLSLQSLSASLSNDFKLEGITLTLEATEQLAVLGPNGAGKSFLLRLILGLETPEAGTISWNDRPLSKAGRVIVPPEDRAMGVVFQEGALFPHLNVRQNVALAIPKTLKGKKRAARIGRALELSRIRHLEGRSIQSLSGGEQQRVALARAMVFNPKVLLLDEPFHSLDGPLKREILAEVRELVVGEKIATILVTHDTEEAAAFADRIVLLREGRMVQTGTFEELYSRPIDRATADFLGPVESIELARARASAIELPETGDSTTLCFRREHLELEAVRDEKGGLDVVDVRAHGALRDVALQLDDGKVIIARTLARAEFQVGQKVRARISRTLSWGES